MKRRVWVFSGAVQVVSAFLVAICGGRKGLGSGNWIIVSCETTNVRSNLSHVSDPLLRLVIRITLHNPQLSDADARAKMQRHLEIDAFGGSAKKIEKRRSRREEKIEKRRSRREEKRREEKIKDLMGPACRLRLRMADGSSQLSFA